MSATSADTVSESEQVHHLVEVFLEVTNEEGASASTTLELPRGETAVETLEAELGIADAEQLWVIKKDGKRKLLASHEKHDVKEGDRFQALVKGGVS
jgi:hypothetical protein